jgi:hypothetical protein
MRNLVIGLAFMLAFGAGLFASGVVVSLATAASAYAGSSP